MEGSSEDDEGVEVRPYLEEQELRRQAQEEAERQTWKYKLKHLPTRDKLFVFFISLSLALPIIMNVLVYPALEPHPDTEVEYCEIAIIESARNWEHLVMKINNDGSDETAEVTLEITLPDNLKFNFDDKENTKCSRPPNFNYTEDRLLVYRWYYLLPHTSIEISLHIDFIGAEVPSIEVWPEHIVVSSKGEHGPIYEYPNQS